MTRFGFAFAACALLAGTPVQAQSVSPLQPPIGEPQAASPRPAFPEDAKIAFVNLQVVFEQSALGRESFAKLRSFDTEKEQELQAKAKDIGELQNRLDTQRNILAPDAYSLLADEVALRIRQLEFDRETVQIGRNRLQQELMDQFNRRVPPEAEKIRAARGLWIILSVADAGVIAAHPGLDLSAEVIQALDAARE